MLYTAIQHISLFGVPTIRYERDRDTNFFLWVIKRETVLKNRFRRNIRRKSTKIHGTETESAILLLCWPSPLNRTQNIKVYQDPDLVISFDKKRSKAYDKLMISAFKKLERLH